MTIDKSRHIILIGPMGAGKSTVGSILAKKLEMEFYDIDSELERKCGVSISLIFEIEKEEGFRKRETAMLGELLQKPPCIIATGGGIVVKKENLERIRESHSTVIYLCTDVKQQLFRLRKDKKRPLLQGKDRRHKLEQLAKTRNSLYESIATKQVRTGHQSAYKMASILIKHYL